MIGVLTRFVGRLRYPWLVLVAFALLVADLIIPDFVPFLDELLLALLTGLLASRKQRDEPVDRP